MSAVPTRQVALVTGCSPGGIGYNIVEAFRRKGVHVIATARNIDTLQHLLPSIPLSSEDNAADSNSNHSTAHLRAREDNHGQGVAKAGIDILALDVTNEESIQACVEAVAQLTDGGRLDYLVNNAGVTYVMPAADADMKQVRRLFDTNVFGVMALTQALIPFLIKARGLIVQVSSLASITPYLYASAYSASKAALNGYSRTLRAELAPLGVRVMVSMTGTVRSNIAAPQHQFDLPETSIYRPVKDIFHWRQTFSQDHATSDTGKFAVKLVTAAMREPSLLSKLRWKRTMDTSRPGFAWAGQGAPKWFWAGGFANRVRLITTFGENALDFAYRRPLRMDEIEKRFMDANKKNHTS